MNLLCKLALLIVPINIVAVAIIQLELLNQISREVTKQHFGNYTLLVIAHPDDETMFFGPLVLNLIDERKHLDILCLSHGSSDGPDSPRAKELATVVDQLGPLVRLRILADHRIPDGLDRSWDEDIISHHVVERLSAMGNKPTVVTFDSYGVSGHPNHRSIFKALETLRARSRHLMGKVHHLESVNVLRKYISFFDTLVSYLSGFLINSQAEAKEQFTVGLNFQQNNKLRTLLALHESQMVWFRQLYSLFSRYMFINDFIMAA